MEWRLTEKDAAEEMESAFVKVGQQFRMFYRAMRKAGHSRLLSAALTVQYCRVVCDLLYMDGCDDGE